jgi:hypothetical protein
MNTLMSAVCAGLILLVLAVFARNLFRRTYDVLSWRNLFLVGFLHFVLLSGYFTASSGYGVLRQSATTGTTMMQYSLCAILALAVFMSVATWAYRRGFAARLVPSVRLAPTTPGVLAAIAVLLAVSLAAAIGPQSGYTGLLAVNMRSGMAATAMGLATFYLLASRFNPVSWALFAFTLGAAAVISTVGGIGRRDLLGVLIAIPWMWYWMSLRYRSAKSIALFAGAATVATFVAIALFSTVRAEGTDAKTGVAASKRLDQFTELITNPTGAGRVLKYLVYTDTANVSMFIMANYPENYAYMPGHTLLWVLVNPIPRAIYPDKPDALGAMLSRQMNIDANLGPGVLGQGWSEGGLIGVLLFAGVLALIYGTVDRALIDRAQNPYAVALMAAGAGNVLAMARGDVGLFAIQIAASMIGSWLVLLGVKVAVGPVAAAFPLLRVRGLAPGGPHEGTPIEAGQDGGHDGGQEADGVESAPEYSG